MVVPDGVPPERAVLAGTVETAVNALWDAAPLLGDRVAVVGAGMVGLLRRPAARPASPEPRSPWSTSTRPGTRWPTPSASGSRCPATPPAAATSSSTRAPRRTGSSAQLDLLAVEGTVIELSWYGDAEVRLSLGGAFHSGRLGIRASQVGTVAAARRGRRTTADRMALALDLLRDPAFDVLLTGSSRFDDLPEVMPRLASGSLPALCHTITYDEG